MAYSSVRVQFEIGHEASVRTKKTPEGFTHDWEVFVRGADNTDIQCFVDKVVFHLHETFPKPRRVIKEPPYVVKESGYAGFVLPIDVYLKNKEEPKKISFHYDLTLQSSGPPISRVLREPRLFQNPSEDFRRKLIRGGGVGVDTPSEPSTEDLKSAPSISQNKSKPADSPMKKHKPDLPLNHSFAELFGTPIRRVPEQKKLPEPPKKVDDKKKTNKPYKDEKEKYLEREKSKEKVKRPPSPSLPPPPAPQVKPKDEHKKYEEKEKKKDEEKKKRKDEKDKKEKTKESDRQTEKEVKKDKKETRDGDYAKKLNSKPPDVKVNYEKHNNEVLDREKERLEKEKHKHRHKNKEKEKIREKDKHRREKEKDLKEKEKSDKKKHEETKEKEEKRRKSKSPSPVQIKKGPLNALLDELGSSDSASPLSEDESISSVKPLLKTPAKTVPETKPMATVTPKPKSTNSVEPTLKLDDANLNKNKKEKSSSKKMKKSDKDSEKKKDKEEPRARSVSSERAEREEEEEKEKTNKEERPDKDKLEEEKPKPKDKENRKRKREKSEEKQTKSKKNEGSNSGAVEGADGSAEELRRPDKFTKEYVAQLRDLQHRIMTLEDNAELQKVVKVIAETGQYEVTKKTFDFDLCALDLETVKRLQEFFAPT